MVKTRNYECPICEKLVNNPQAMKVHIKFKHAEDFAELYECDDSFVPEKVD